MSNLAFEYVFFSKVSEPAVICCIIGLLNIYLPTFWINEVVFGKSKPKFAEGTYEEVKHKFEFVTRFFFQLESNNYMFRTIIEKIQQLKTLKNPAKNLSEKTNEVARV